MTDVHIVIPNPLINEATSFTATAYFRLNGSASASSVNSKYRIDNLSTGKELADWTTLTPAVSIDIPITSAHNKIQQPSNKTEKIRLTVASDRGETSATYSTVIWKVRNYYGYTGNT